MGSQAEAQAKPARSALFYDASVLQQAVAKAGLPDAVALHARWARVNRRSFIHQFGYDLLQPGIRIVCRGEQSFGSAGSTFTICAIRFLLRNF